MSTQSTTTDEFANIPLELIVSSPTNPRKTFDAAKLQELTESIKASGVHQPILVRPLPGSRLEETSHVTRGGRPLARATHELVCGERRHRASLLAGVATIPAMIRDLTDGQVREIQIVENLQRDDLTELEEAEGYEQLMQHSTLTADQVGGKIGKSRSYVYGRLKLLDLGMECKEAMRAGKIDASRALLIARIPDSKLQIKALEFVTKPQGYPPEPPSVRVLQSWLRDNVMLKLDHAVFKLTDSRLVESAGSCPDCPKRTGANPDLFSEVDSADICTDPTCYHAKEDAHRAQLIKKAEAKGMRIVEGKEALELLEGRQYWNLPDGYTDLADKRPDLCQEGDRPATLGQLLGADAPAPILFVHPRTQVITELVPEAEAEAVLLAKGLIKIESHRAEQSADLDKQLTHLQDAAKRETDKAVHNALHEAARGAIRAAPQAQAQRLLTGEVLRAYLLHLLDEEQDEDNIAYLCNYEFADGVDETDAITSHIQRLGDTDLLRTVALSLLDRDRSPYNLPLLQEAFVKALDLDTKVITKKASATVRAEYADRIKSLQAQIDAPKPAKPLVPLASAAQAKGGGGAGGQKSESPAALAREVPVRKRKLTADEAKAAIAAAMQGQDTEPGADAQGVDADSSPPVAAAVADAPSVALAVGMRVCVTSDTAPLELSQCKWAGKEGTITQQLADGAWMLSFKGRNGGMASFDGKLLTVPKRLVQDNAVAKAVKVAVAAS